MRTFSVGSGEKRKFVILDLQGTMLRVTKGQADGTTRKSEHAFPNIDRARLACEKAMEDLTAHGYLERDSSDRARASTPVKPPSKKPPAPPDRFDLGSLADEAETLLPRLTPVAEPKPKKTVKKKKKKRKEAGDELDKRVVAGMVGFGLLCVAAVGFFAYEAFLKPPSIIGHWEGSRTEHEIGKFVMNTQYRLILDDRKNASMSIQDSDATKGTYVLQGDRLKLNLKDEDGEASEVQFQVKLGGATLDLFDPESGKKVVQLIRFHQDSVKSKGTVTPPKDVAVGPVDQGADERLASVPYSARDGAFRLRHPPGWEADTGGREDNSYSWAKFARGSARIRIYADVAGSLLAGPNSADFEEGSELAPVHGAHERYKKDAAEMYGNYEESKPVTFKGSAIGEGRISTFTSSGEGMFGSKLRGIRVTLLTNDRRVSILCDAPAKLFDGLLPTFLATCRSLSR